MSEPELPRGWRRQVYVRAEGVSRFVVAFEQRDVLEPRRYRRVFGHGDELAEAEDSALREIRKRKRNGN